MNLSEAVQFLADEAKARGADQFDIVAQNSQSLGLSVFQSKVQQTEISESVGIGIRLFSHGAPGYASTERLTPEALRQTIKDALDHSTLTEPVPIELPAQAPMVKLESQWNDSIEALDLDSMATFALQLEKQVFAASAEIENVPHLGYGISSGTSIFANSKGIWHQERENSYGVGVGAVGLRQGIRKMGVYHRSGRDLSRLNANEIAQIAAERSLELLGAQAIAGGDLPVLLSNRVSGQILSMFLTSFHGETVQKGQSRLAGMLGKSIAVAGFNLWSDPHRQDLPGSTAMDGEGVPTQKRAVIENGVLQTYLHHLESARRDGVPSTGHGSRGYSGRVGTSFHNAIVPLSTQSADQLLCAYPLCLEIVKLEGSSGCSAVSGEISIGAQGFLVKNGVRQHPVDGITLSTNFFDLLHNIVGVGNAYNDSFSSVRVPDLLIQKISVSA